MSFGWSAGDIAATIALAYNLIQVLDSCDGAAHEYREAVSFLRDLRRTLEPLAQFPNLTAQPGYGKEIAEQSGIYQETCGDILEVCRAIYGESGKQVLCETTTDISFRR